MTWKPCPRVETELHTLPLDPRQGYLLSLLDGSQDVPTLAAILNTEEAEISDMLAALVACGAVEPEQGGSPTPAPDQVPVGPPAEACAEEATRSPESATHRQLFEQRLHAKPVDERVALAHQAQEPELSAFCFDPAPEVIRALLENPRAGLLQARLIASHHRTAAGLEALGARAALVTDAGVRRALLQNPLLPAGLFRRLWSPKRLLEHYLVATSREAPEQVRAMARDLLRTTFNQRTGEERAEFILTTEGRCLTSLVGLTLDGHTTALLCRRTYVSTLLIQNIARWSAAPPALIAHLRRQEVVKRNPVLRQLLDRHPNAS